MNKSILEINNLTINNHKLEKTGEIYKAFSVSVEFMIYLCQKCKLKMLTDGGNTLWYTTDIYNKNMTTAYWKLNNDLSCEELMIKNIIE